MLICGGESPKKGCQLPDTLHFSPSRAAYLLFAAMTFVVAAAMTTVALVLIILAPMFTIVTMLRIPLVHTPMGLMNTLM